jgi:hypothetical protein
VPELRVGDAEVAASDEEMAAGENAATIWTDWVCLNPDCSKSPAHRD